MPRFILLHRIFSLAHAEITEPESFIRTDAIHFVHKRKGGGSIIEFDGDWTQIYVTEEPQEVLDLITGAKIPVSNTDLIDKGRDLPS